MWESKVISSHWYVTVWCSIIAISKVIIPIGGLGTRLYPITVETSKAMVRFLNTFLINFILQTLAVEGIEEAYLGVSGYVNYKSLHDHLGGGLKIRIPAKGFKLIRIRYQPNEDSVGNAHSTRVILSYYKILEPVLVVQGDTVAKINLREFYKRHKETRAFMSIALKEISDPRELRHFGVAKLDEKELIKGFIEKPKTPEEAPSRLVNTGIYILSKEMIEFLLSDEFDSMVKENKADFGANIIPKIINDGYTVAGYVLKDYWFDIGTPERYLEASLYLLRVLEPEYLEASTVYRSVRMQGSSPASRALHVDLIEKAATKRILFEGDVLLGRHIRIGDGSLISNSIIDNYTIIDREATISNSVVMDRCYLGSKTLVDNSIVGRHSRIGSNVKIIESYLGDNVIVEDGAELVNCKVWPHRVIKAGSKCRDESII
ncbi:MAG: NDP-sugar synthase [Acidilobaceae archaeon]